MSMIPMPPEGIEASIFAQIIIQHWTDDIRKAKQEAEAVGENALRHNLDCAQFILEACSQLFDAATKGDYEYMSKVSEGISVVQVQGEPESAKDILQRIVCDLSESGSALEGPFAVSSSETVPVTCLVLSDQFYLETPSRY